MFLDPNTSTSLQATLTADAYLAEGQYLLEEQTSNNAESMVYRAKPRRPTISKTEGYTKVHLNKKDSIEEMPPHTKNVQF
jgi:hypothetical protein